MTVIQLRIEVSSNVIFRLKLYTVLLERIPEQ